MEKKNTSKIVSQRKKIFLLMRNRKGKYSIIQNSVDKVRKKKEETLNFIQQVDNVHNTSYMLKNMF